MSHAGPVAPTSAAALSTVQPLALDAVRLDRTGLLGGWQDRNAAATLPHCVKQLDEAGNLANLRNAGEGRGEFAGMWFADSDVYKTLEAAAWEIARSGETPPQDFLDATTALLERAQGEDGYLNSYFTLVKPDSRWAELDWSHELYCAGHLIQAAVAAARAGVGADLVAVARRFADLLVDRFGPSGVEGVCGHPEIETALVELYRVTGHRAYLDLAAAFVDRRGRGLLGAGRFGPRYFQDHEPVRAATEVTGHVVRQLYLLAGVVDVAVETGDRILLGAAERLWDDAFGTKTYLTGAHGSRHRDEAFGDPYELPPDRAYNESCAAIASFQWNWRMLLATGRARYADEMERVLYNGIAVASALDGRHFFYSNPLQLRTGHDGSDEDSPSERLPWYSCACCPPNLARLVASLHGYVSTVDGDGVQLQLYGAGTITTEQARLRVRTAYPWDGRVEITVDAAAPAEWTLSLRVPAWCERAGVEIDGVAFAARPEGGYLRVRRTWSGQAVVTLDLTMPPRLVTAHPRVDAVRGCVAVARGPLAYCVEAVDLPPDTVLEDFRLDPAAPVQVVDPGPFAGTVGLAVSGTVSAAPEVLYGAEPADAGDPVTLSAVPYFLWGNRKPGAMRVWLPWLDRGDSGWAE
jgi:uncharacterized protein